MTTIASSQTASPAGRADRAHGVGRTLSDAPECTCAAAAEKEHLPIAAFAPFVLTVAALLALRTWTDLDPFWRVALAVVSSAAGTAVVAGVERAVRRRRRA
ncbi:hypothetical protein E4A47_10985 [Micrococcus flavus]|uniref:Uncharacterized protein n=1 Tax=Micrococcus flavus TaxID=384602 RepID=A0A4Y8WUS1_9MICC|nr:hypothetical protein [Micrococcus flavus]MBB4881681.1 hypothetical protein [Micrococcus flavus]TFH98738.1 hypothetical protein E4A47_10985 [Micrococcus flavus]GGK53994.1 hypothetical protein GCM10007073_21320 [Micrococcus flavus]